jgi:hypothetical protein
MVLAPINYLGLGARLGRTSAMVLRWHTFIQDRPLMDAPPTKSPMARQHGQYGNIEMISNIKLLYTTAQMTLENLSTQSPNYFYISHHLFVLQMNAYVEHCSLHCSIDIPTTKRNASLRLKKPIKKGRKNLAHTFTVLLSDSYA